MNLKEEIEKLSATAEYMCFSDSKYMRVIAIENAVLVAESYAKEKDDEIQALKVRIEELEFELKRAEEHIDGMKSING